MRSYPSRLERLGTSCLRSTLFPGQSREGSGTVGSLVWDQRDSCHHMNGEWTSERRDGMGTQTVEEFDIYEEPPVDRPWHTSSRRNEFVK